MRPYPPGSSTSAVSTVTMLRARSCSRASSSRVLPRSKRHVAVGDDDLALDEADGLDHGPHGMTRAACRSWTTTSAPAPRGDVRRGHLVPAMA